LAFAMCVDALVAWQVPQTALGRLAAFPGRVAATAIAMAHALVNALREGPELQLEIARRRWFPGV
jgi:hypothetical protein